MQRPMKWKWLAEKNRELSASSSCVWLLRLALSECLCRFGGCGLYDGLDGVGVDRRLPVLRQLLPIDVVAHDAAVPDAVQVVLLDQPVVSVARGAYESVAVVGPVTQREVDDFINCTARCRPLHVGPMEALKVGRCHIRLTGQQAGKSGGGRSEGRRASGDGRRGRESWRRWTAARSGFAWSGGR